MKKIIIGLLMLLLIAINAIAYTAEDLSGRYSGLFNAFLGYKYPISTDVGIQLNASGMWYVLCSQTYGSTTYEYPCDGVMYTWYINNVEDTYPIKLDMFNDMVSCKATGLSNLYCFIDNTAADVFLSKDTGTIISCKNEVTMVTDNITFDRNGGTGYFVATTNSETCSLYNYIPNVSWIKIEGTKPINKTNDTVYKFTVLPNTDNVTRTGVIQGNYYFLQTPAKITITQQY